VNLTLDQPAMVPGPSRTQARRSRFSNAYSIACRQGFVDSQGAVSGWSRTFCCSLRRFGSRVQNSQFCTNICRSRLLVAALSASHTCRMTAEFDTMTLVYSADCNSCMHPRIRIGGGEQLHCEDAERKAPLPF
jgi:hypothetical protein